MSEFLIWANEDKPGFGIKRGDVVEVRANDTPYSAMEKLPDFIVIKFPELLLAPVEEYQNGWDLVIDYEIVNHNAELDSYRIRAFSIMADNSGKGYLTRIQIENYLDQWNAAIFLVVPNVVVFDISIFNAIQSSIFWDDRSNLEDVVFSEIYNEVTGIHEVTADYSALNLNPTYVERYIREKADNIISHSNREIVFTITRNNIFSEFKEDFKRKLARMKIAKRLYYFGKAVVDNVISRGGIITATPAELIQYLKSKLDD